MCYTQHWSHLSVTYAGLARIHFWSTVSIFQHPATNKTIKPRTPPYIYIIQSTVHYTLVYITTWKKEIFSYYCFINDTKETMSTQYVYLANTESSLNHIFIEHIQNLIQCNQQELQRGSYMQMFFTVSSSWRAAWTHKVSEACPPGTETHSLCCLSQTSLYISAPVWTCSECIIAESHEIIWDDTASLND